MTEIPQTHRKTLNKDQLQILYLLYKFRFTTTELIVKSQNNQISRQYVNKRLSILCDQEYIGRRYDGSYRLAGKPATYHLLPKGIKLLKQRSDDFNPKVLKNISNDRRASDRFINHSLQVLDIYCLLKMLYRDRLKFFTGSYLKLPLYEYFPKPLPDAYISLDQDNLKHYLLDYFESSAPFFVIKKRIKYYVSYIEDNIWPRSATTPAILLVCDTEELRKRIEVEAASASERTWKDILFATAVKSELSGTTVWSRGDKPKVKLRLEQLL